MWKVGDTVYVAASHVSNHEDMASIKSIDHDAGLAEILWTLAGFKEVIDVKRINSYVFSASDERKKRNRSSSAPPNTVLSNKVPVAIKKKKLASKQEKGAKSLHEKRSSVTPSPVPRSKAVPRKSQSPRAKEKGK